MHVGTDFLKLPPVTGQYWSLFQCSVLGTGGTCEVTDDARPQRPSPNDEPHDTCTETARDRENGTTMVPERDGDVCRWHVRR